MEQTYTRLLAVWLYTQYLCGFSSCTVTEVCWSEFLGLVWIRILHGNAFVVPFPCFSPAFIPFLQAQLLCPSRSRARPVPTSYFFHTFFKCKVCTTAKCKQSMPSRSCDITACTITGPAITAELNLILVTVPAVFCHSRSHAKL